MKMHVLSGGRLRMRKSIYFPDVAKDATIEMPVCCILLKHPKGNVLFDTGCHPSAATDPEGRWGPLAKVMTPIMARETNVLTELQAVGMEPDEINCVICSHLHPDHCGCNQFFQMATVVVHNRELAAAKEPGATSAGFLPADWDHPMPMRVVDKETDLFGDGRIVLVPLPGHTPGMMGALVQLDRDGQFLLASDAVSLRANLDQDFIPKNTWNVEQCRQSFAEVRRLEKAGAKVICGHDLEQWETLRKGMDAYE
jgi:glyoxylase-like metal-dependent hydrolase (beta-lactamase superfamily II)